jgi:hypothetical protein
MGNENLEIGISDLEFGEVIQEVVCNVAREGIQIRISKFEFPNPKFQILNPKF